MSALDSFLNQHQKELGYDKCLKILERKEDRANRMILYGEAGVGKTRISIAVIHSFLEKHKGGPAVFLFLLKYQYFYSWVIELKALFEDIHDLVWDDPTTWQGSVVVKINTQTMQDDGICKIRDFLNNVNNYPFKYKKIFLFVDLNYLLYNNNPNQSLAPVHFLQVRPEPISLLLTPLHILVFHYVKLVLMDEADFPRSKMVNSNNKCPHHRKTIVNIINRLLPRVPVLINNATPLGGLASDIQNMADFFQIQPEQVQSRVVYLKKQDVLGADFPALGVFMVNVTPASSWLVYKPILFLQKMHLFIQKIVKGEANNEDDAMSIFLSQERFFALFFMLYECAATFRADYTGLRKRLLVTVERIHTLAVIKQLFFWIFCLSDEDTIPEEFRDEFFEPCGEQYCFKGFQDEEFSQFCVIEHTGAGTSNASYRYVPKLEETSAEEVASNRDIFCQGRYREFTSLLYLQSMRGARGWSCNPSDGSYIVHVLFHGFDSKFGNNIQAVSRTNRFNSHFAALVVVFCSSNEADLQKNVTRFNEKCDEVSMFFQDEKAKQQLQELSQTVQSDHWKNLSVDGEYIARLKMVLLNPPVFLEQTETRGVTPVKILCNNLPDTAQDIMSD